MWGWAQHLFFIVLAGAGCSPAMAQHEVPRSQRDVLRVQAEIWDLLDRQTRKVIVERSRFVYQLDENLIIDAYELMSWREMLEDSIVKEKIREERRTTGIRRTLTIGYKWFYEIEPKRAAYFDIKTYPVMFWYSGLLLNNKVERRDLSHQALIDASSAQPGKTSDERVLSWIANELPLVTVVDPLTRTKEPDAIYTLIQSGGEQQVRFSKGIVTSARNGMRAMPIPRKGAVSLFDPYPKQIVIEPNSVRSDGKPDPALEAYMLFASIKTKQIQKSAFSSGSTTKNTIEYSIKSPRAFQLRPKELAVLLMEGKLEIPYRVVEKNKSGEWVCTEYLLERP